MGYFIGRPGPSPVIAALYAAGNIKNHHVVLDVGAGDGTDAIALMHWGVREVHMLDVDKPLLDHAARRVASRWTQMEGGRRVGAHHGSITEFHECFRLSQFDVVRARKRITLSF